MDKQNLEHLYNGISFSHKKAWSTDTYTIWMNLKNITLSKISQAQRLYTMFPFIWNVQKRQISRGRRVDPLGVGMGYCCSDAKLYPTTCLCNPTDCAHQAPLSMGFFRQEYWSGLPFPSPGYHLLEFAQTFVHWVSDAIQPSHPLSPPSLPAFNLSQHWGLFQWVSSLHQRFALLDIKTFIVKI